MFYNFNLKAKISFLCKITKNDSESKKLGDKNTKKG
jgi:hypothetical protein